MTGWKQPANTVTASQIKALYQGITGKELYAARRKLEILGYIEPVRKGSQTYRLLKPDIPDNLTDLTAEYLITNFTYTMPKDYHKHIELPLTTMLNNFKSWSTGNWGNMNEPIARACEELSKAVNMLPELAVPFEFKFICQPARDTLLLGDSRENRVANLANLLTQTAYRLCFECNERGYTEDSYLKTAEALEEAAGILKQMHIPTRYKYFINKTKP